MLSNLGPLFKTVFRETEHADARLEIRREEKESGRKNKGRDTSETEDSALWEDSTGVSVTALRTFLIEFLKEKGGQPLPSETAAETIHIPSQSPPISTAAARAAQAYGATASHIHHTPPPMSVPEQQGEDLVSLLESDEIRTIHRLIGELDILNRAGVETLNFQLNGTFLESVAEAVRIERTQRGI